MDDPFLQALEKRRLSREAERMAIIKRMAQLNADAEADAVAKRVYVETQAAAETDGPASPVPDKVEAAPSPPTNAAGTDKPMVKDMIMTVLRAAYPNGLTAKQIKAKAYLRYQQHVNPNTLTVTLGRFSKPKEGAPIARCEGRTWYYIRSEEAQPKRAPELALLNGSHHAAE